MFITQPKSGINLLTSHCQPRPQISCVYKLTNTINGKIYIGKAIDFYLRMYSHSRSALKITNDGNNPISNAIHKYGWDSFKQEILEEADSAQLFERETFHIIEKNSTDPSIGYNVLIFAFDRTGTKHTEETRAKIKATTKLKAVRGDNHYQKRQINYAAVHAMQRANTGTPRSEAVKSALSAAHKGRRAPWAERPVLQLDSHSGEVIREWPSAMEPTRAYSKASYASNIKNCCTLRPNANGSIQKTAYGFGWKFAPSKGE